MLLLYYTQSILFYLGFVNNDFGKSLHAYDLEYLPREVCVAQCLERNKTQTTALKRINGSDYTKKMLFQICLDDCIVQNERQQKYKNNRGDVPVIKQIQENYILNLICRDDNRLNFRVDMHTIKNKADQIPNKEKTSLSITKPMINSSISDVMANSMKVGKYSTEKGHGKTIFVIKIHLARNAKKFFAYLSDDNFFTIDSLMANTTYNISLLAVHSNNKYSVIAKQQQFSTLRRGYTPGNVTEIKVTNFTEDKWNKMLLTATLRWKPAADLTCHYDVICFAPDSADYEFQPLEIRDPRQLYKYKLENLTFSSVYKVGIRAINTKNMRESDLFWKTFTAPSCVEWHNYNFNICAPVAPQELQIEQIFEDNNIYTLNISWLQPTHLPDNYTLRIQDLSQDGEIKIYNLKKDVCNIVIPHITFHGVFYEARLTASTPGGHATTSYTDITRTVIHVSEKNPFVKLISGILAPILCIAIVSLILYIIYNRRVKLKRYRKERSKYFQDIEKKSPFDPKENFSLATNIKETSNACQVDLDDLTLFNDDMEIDRANLILYEVLGEGAFGLVKRGIYKDVKEGTVQEVAVKMLKDHPSPDEIRAFGLEIEVMKSVKKHPNIVGIIGHCTRLNTEMMLLTEYCSFGNLLNFLRDEWRFLHELQRKKKILTTNVVEIELPQIMRPYSKSNGNSNAENLPTTTLISSEHHKIIDALKSSSKSNISEESKQLVYGHTTCDSLKKNSDEYDNVNDNYITKKFKKKLKASKIDTSGLKFFIKSNNITNIGLNIEKLQYTDDLNSSLRIIGTNRSISDLISPAAENKSYGYHGCCTNSCKSEVDVIIQNVDSKATIQQQSEEQLLKTSQCTTIKIKDCDCKRKEQSSQQQRQQQQQITQNKNKRNSVVENLAYFKSYGVNKALAKPDGLWQDQISVTTAMNTFNKTKQKIIPQTQITTTVSNNVNNYCTDSNRVPLTCDDLLDIARQVAVGMEFLAKCKVVHRDLAARNILVTSDRNVKISDFGLSRDVYRENMYKKTGNGKLPIKWLALESMTHQVYTTQSDVWSYGILLYEIVTLGATPYPSIPTNRLLELLKSGYRMEKPKNCDEEFYNLMSSCWNIVPNDRPTFTEIVQKLDVMLKDDNIPINVNTAKTETKLAVCDKMKELSQQESSVQLSSDDSYLTPLHQ